MNQDARTRSLDPAIARHQRMVSTLLTKDLLLRNVGFLSARFDFIEPGSTLDDLLAAVVEAADIAIDHARLAEENGGRFPRNVTPYPLEALLQHRFEFALAAVMLTGSLDGIEERYSLPSGTGANMIEIADSAREALQ